MISGIAREEFAHRGQWRSFMVSIRKDEALCGGLVALEALAMVCSHRERVIVPTLMEEEGADAIDRVSVKAAVGWRFALEDVDRAHDHGRFARPQKSTRRAVDRAMVVANPAQSAASGISLSDRVGADEAECVIRADVLKSPSEKICVSVYLKKQRHSKGA